MDFTDRIITFQRHLFGRDFLLGGLSSFFTKTATAPIERVKIILQTEGSNMEIKNEKDRINSLKDCLKMISNKEDRYSLWRGNSANLIRYFPTQALSFAFKEKYRRIFNTFDPREEFWKHLGTCLLAGGFAGSSTLVFVYPLDFLRTRLAADIGKRTYSGLGDCAKQIYSTEGMFGFYKGFGLSMFGIFLYRAPYFGLYDSGKFFIPEKNNFLPKMILAKITTLIAGYLTYPMDTVRRRMMMQSGRAESDIQYNNKWHCVKILYKEAGIKIFYKGAVVNIARGFGTSLALVIYDELQESLDDVLDYIEEEFEYEEKQSKKKIVRKKH